MKPCETCGYIESLTGKKEDCVRCLRARVALLERAAKHIAEELSGQVNHYGSPLNRLSHGTRIYLMQLAGVAADPTRLS